MSKTLFISDLHLSAERPDIAQCFFDFMKNEAIQADALYILGDLFEVWLGDDDVTVFSEQIANAILAVSQKLPVYFIHGNRDFALGNKFARKCNMTLLPEQYVIDLYSTPTLISHGDELCTRDVEYMKFRKKARGWWWPRMMKAIPLSIRRKLAQKGRATSQENQKHLSAEIMDVTPSEVTLAMRKHNVLQFIHGHTHRPNCHTFTIDNQAAKRFVLGDWYTQGSVLIATENSLNLETRSFL
jgi:UDP-2,3-diacylglucosamine hydrolase